MNTITRCINYKYIQIQYHHVLHSFLIGKLTPVMYVVYKLSRVLDAIVQKKLSKLGDIF